MTNIRLFSATIAALLFVAGAGRLAAQGPAPSGRTVEAPQPSGVQRGLSLRVVFEGSTSSQGQVFDLNTSTSYMFNHFFGVDVGVPIYFVRASAPAPGSGTAPGTSAAGNLGDLYMAAHLTLDNPIATYTTTITVTAPTGSVDKGRSTGHFTYDWDNRFERELGKRLTPYISAGFANTASQSRYRKRPYLTLGKLAHFEVGADVRLWKSLTFTAAAYDVIPWGQQTVFSRFVQRGSVGTGAARRRRVFEIFPQTVGNADLVRDNGYSAGLSFSPTPLVDVAVGYTRSVPMHLDTFNFSVGLNVSRMFHRSRM